MSQTTNIERKLIVRDREVEFPNRNNERAFKASLAKTPLVSELLIERDGERRIYKLLMRPADFNEFRRQLKARGLENCPTTNFLFNLLIRRADERISFTTCLN